MISYDKANWLGSKRQGERLNNWTPQVSVPKDLCLSGHLCLEPWTFRDCLKIKNDLRRLRRITPNQKMVVYWQVETCWLAFRILLYFQWLLLDWNHEVLSCEMRFHDIPNLAKFGGPKHGKLEKTRASALKLPKILEKTKRMKMECLPKLSWMIRCLCSG